MQNTNSIHMETLFGEKEEEEQSTERTSHESQTNLRTGLLEGEGAEFVREFYGSIFFYQASALSQLEPGDGASVSLVRAQVCAGDCSCSMLPLRKVSRVLGE